MSARSTISRALAALVCSAAISLAVSCSDKTSPTGSSATGTVSGTVILGSSAASSTVRARPEGMEIGMAGVTVRHTASGRSAVTDSAGNFTLTGIPSGSAELQLERADVHARVTIMVAAGSTTTVTISVSGSTAVTVPRGHAGEEIEGLIQAVDATGLTVIDQRLGAVVVKVTVTTAIVHGNTPVALSDLKVGQRVHVKALLEADNTYTATEIQLQDQNVGGHRNVSGSVTSVDAAAKSFVLSSGGVSITITTNSSTKFHKRGSTASFADVTVGAMVDVNGILQGDGSILATKVDIES